MADEKERPDDEILLDYLSDRLTADRKAEVEAAAAADPDLAAEIALMRGVREAMQAEVADAPPGELGWKRLERAIDRETAGAHTPEHAPATTAPANVGQIWRVAAMAAVAAVVTWQVVAVPIIGGRGAGYETASETPLSAHSLTVAFVPTATEAQIRGLLSDTGGRVIDGPTALGLWQIGFDTETLRDEARVNFDTSAAIVDMVQAN